MQCILPCHFNRDDIGYTRYLWQGSFARNLPASSVNDDIGKDITVPLPQQAKYNAYYEGGTYGFIVKHIETVIYIKPSANYIQRDLKDIRADILMIGLGSLGRQPQDFAENFFNEKVGMLQPKLVVPLHWDNFFLLTEPGLRMIPILLDDSPKGIDFMMQKTKAAGIDLKILDAEKSLVVRTQKGN